MPERAKVASTRNLERAEKPETTAIVLRIAADHAKDFEAMFEAEEIPIWDDFSRRGRFLDARLVDDLEYRRSVPGFGNPFDGVARGDAAFLEDREVESRSAAREETPDHVGPPESDAELVAGKAGLRHLQQGRADAQLRPDAELPFSESFRREVLPECTPRQVRPLEVLPPEGVGFARVRVDGLRRASVDREIRLTVSDEPQGPDLNPTHDGFLENPRRHPTAAPFDRLGQRDVHRDDVHRFTRPPRIIVPRMGPRARGRGSGRPARPWTGARTPASVC